MKSDFRNADLVGRCVVFNIKGNDYRLIDAEILRHLMEAKGVNQSDVAKGAKIAKSTISEILAGKSFPKQTIGKLADFFGVDKGILAANL